MDDETIDYPQLVREALRLVPQMVLARVAEEGLPGEHHFYLTVRSTHPGVEMPQELRSRYPDKLTVVLQHQFWDLVVDDQGFGVTLAFGGARKHLYVPWDALEAFADPEAEFGLQFEPVEPQPREPEQAVEGEQSPEAPTSPKVISFDRHRRRQDQDDD